MAEVQNVTGNGSSTEMADIAGSGNEYHDYDAAELCVNYSQFNGYSYEQEDGSMVTFPPINSYEDCLHYIYGQVLPGSDVHRVPAVKNAQFYFLAFIIPIGIILNTLSGIVFAQTRMRKLATAYYFFALAFADNTVLVSEFIRWLNTPIGRDAYITGVKFLDQVSGICKFIQFLRYFGWLLSAWLVVLISVERFLAVAYPLRVSLWSTPRKALFIIMGIVFMCVCLTCPAMVFIGIIKYEGFPMCAVLPQWHKGHDIWLLTVRVFGELTLPSLLVIIFTALIIYKLMQARKKRQEATEGQNNTRDDQSRQTTIALLAVAIAFVVLRAPYYISYLDYLIKHRFHDIVVTNHATDLTYILAVTNYAINFFLFMIFGKTFRNEFKRVFKWKVCKKRLYKLHPSKIPRPSLTNTSTSGSATKNNSSSSGMMAQTTVEMKVFTNV